MNLKGIWLQIQPSHYFLFGFFLGGLFPFLSTIVMLWNELDSVILADFVNLHRKNPLLLVIDTAPLVLGLMGYLLGVRQDKLREAYKQIQEMNSVTEKFFPRQFLSILKKESIGKIQPGDTVDIELTVVFTDIRDYTTMSENMKSSEIIVFLNEYLSVMTPCINRNRGFIDKFIGDSVMAVFPESPRDALIACIEMKKALEVLNITRVSRGQSIIRTGFGIHYGKVALGTIGNDTRMQTTVIGDTVNMASRIEGWTKIFKTWILMSETVALKLAEFKEFHIREIDIVGLKGKKNTMSIYESYDADSIETIQSKTEYKFDMIMAMAMYRDHEFKEAERIFRECIQQCPGDPLPLIYLNRCHEKKSEIMDILEDKKRKSVMIIDDNEVIITLMEKYFKKNNIEVNSTISPIQAMFILENFIPDVIFIDYQLPDKNGLELAFEIKDFIHSRNLPTKLVMMTASEETLFTEAVQKGVLDGFLPKPFYESDLIQMFYKAIGEIEKNL
jgi:class 3 adenylate cyclase/ActR/RegA family two-component response regulator